MTPRGALFGLVLFASAALAADPITPGFNFFSGDALPGDEPRENRNPLIHFLARTLGSDSTLTPDSGSYPHEVTFQDGRRLTGQLLSLDGGTLIWKRADASEPLRFTRSEVRDISLRGRTNPNESQPVRTESEALSKRAFGAKATVKLPGGDWLYTDVSTTDGNDFTVAVESGTHITVNRSAIDWLHFGVAPAPAINLAPGSMALEGWMGSSPAMRLESREGWMEVKDTQWIGKPVSPPSRFEVILDIPDDDAAKAVTLWLQPFDPQPNCYSRGTIKLSFEPGKLKRCIFIDKITEESCDLPMDKDGSGRARFRIIHDGVDGKLIVLRNDRSVGEWKLYSEKDDQQNRGWSRGVASVSIESRHQIKLAQFRVQPWDGVLPKAGEAVAAGDRLVMGKEAAVTGRLESITKDEVAFSGKSQRRGTGTFVQLEGEPKPGEGMDTILRFGATGELSGKDLEIRDGKARFTASFGGVVEMPVSAVDTLYFQAVKAEAARGPALVFRAGDELPGSVVRAARGEPIVWRTPGGQELQFANERVAGIRLGKAAKPADKHAIVIARNGDSLRGKWSALGDKVMELHHASLGKLSIPRENLWAIYPVGDLMEASADPEAWVNDADRNGGIQFGSNSLVMLDGAFLARGDRRYRSGYTMSRDFKGLPEKLEIRCDLADYSGYEGQFSVDFTGKNSSLSYQFYSGMLQVNGWSSDIRGRSIWKNFELQDRNREGRRPSRRISLRFFADNKRGIIDLYVDGKPVGKIGKTSDERIPGVIGSLRINTGGEGEGGALISNLVVLPWNGELPAEKEIPRISLANGDVAEAVPAELRGDKLIVDPGTGPLEIPMDRVCDVQFGGEPKPESGKGRLRLVNGDAILVDDFRIAEGRCTAKSSLLGEITLPAEAVREAIFNAPEARFPRVVPKNKKLATDAGVPAGEQQNAKE